MYTVELENINKEIHSKRVIKDVSLNIKKGEVFGLLGPNGAGKTTLIRMVVNLTRPTSGTIKICGFDIRKDRAQAMKHIGGIIENPELYTYMTGFENLKHYANMHPGITQQRIREVAELVKIGKNLKQKVKTYSLGMKQRLGLAQALLHNPDILILDEPTNGLDPEGIKEFREYIRIFAKQHQMSVLISSHMLSEMEMICDRIGIIKEGSMIEVREIGSTVSPSTQKYHLKVDNMVEAISIFESFQTSFRKISFNYIEIYLTEERIPQILNALHTNNVNVFEANKISETLEDQYFEAVSGLER